MISDLVLIDEQLFLFLNNLGSSTFDNFWLLITNKLTWIPLYLLLLVYLIKQYSIKKVVAVVVLIALMIGFADQLANLFKNEWVQRLRPCFTEHLIGKFRLVKENCGGAYGFYSAHASNHMAIAVFFIQFFKFKNRFYSILFIIWALLIAYSRVYIGVHFPLDILTGTLIGLILGLIFYRIYKLTKFNIE